MLSKRHNDLVTAPMKLHIQPPELPFPKLREECGVFGLYGDKEAVTYTTLGLHRLQHRGQEAAGIIAFDGTDFHTHKAAGLVSEGFVAQDGQSRFNPPASMAIGHVRYSTAGGKAGLENVQPFLAHTQRGEVALAHNGNLTNAQKLRTQLMADGRTFQSTSDSEVILHLMATANDDCMVDTLKTALGQVKGAYALVMMTRKKMIGVRDPAGVRPLVLGQLGDAYVLASETCALDIIEAQYLRDIEPGEIVVVDEDGLHSYHLPHTSPHRFCIFESIYFMRPNSFFDGQYTSELREKLGTQLAKESPVEADVIAPVPDSGISAAVGFATASGIPFKNALLRSHYAGRTFIEPSDAIRHFGTKLKHSVNPAAVKGQRVVLVDDSIVRGTTIPKIVDMVRKAGAREVHVRISSPPFTHPCFYGVDTPTQKELTAHRMSLAEIEKMSGADSLAYLSIDGLYQAVSGKERNGEKRDFCDACFTGEYTLPLVDEEAKRKEG